MIIDNAVKNRWHLLERVRIQNEDGNSSDSTNSLTAKKMRVAEMSSSLEEMQSAASALLPHIPHEHCDHEHGGHVLYDAAPTAIHAFKANPIIDGRLVDYSYAEDLLRFSRFSLLQQQQQRLQQQQEQQQEKAQQIDIDRSEGVKQEQFATSSDDHPTSLVEAPLLASTHLPPSLNRPQIVSYNSFNEIDEETFAGEATNSSVSDWQDVFASYHERSLMGLGQPQSS